MNVSTLILVGVVFAISSLIYITLSSKGPDTVLERLRIPRLKASDALTPPRSESPGRNGPSQQGHEEVFPPHRREALAELPSNALKGPGKSAKQLSQIQPDYSKLTPDKAVCNTDDLLDHTTATGFTAEEIRRLGDFPDYATLSGIPLPSAYKEFDIKTALPRPYRPYRWPYFQTMCMFATSTSRGTAR